MKLSALITSIVFAVGMAAGPALADETQIVVLSAVFGPAKAAKPVDFTERLAETCGPSASYCQSFCSRAAVGRIPRGTIMIFPHHSVCRITYRCGSVMTRVTEADENDTYSLSCRPRP